MRERQPMIRRPGPPEDPQAQDRMRAILDGHKGRIEARGGVDQSSRSPCKQAEVPGADPVAVPLVQLPMGYDPKADPPTLEWLDPVKWADGSGYVRSTGNAYSVVKERSGEGYRYVAFHGINALGAANGLQTAQDLCLAHYAKACG